MLFYKSFVLILLLLLNFTYSTIVKEDEVITNDIQSIRSMCSQNQWIHWLFYSNGCSDDSLLLKTIAYRNGQCYPWVDGQHSILLENQDNTNNVSYTVFSDTTCTTELSTLSFTAGQCNPQYSLTLQLSNKTIIPQINTLYFERYINGCQDSGYTYDSRIRYSLANGGVCLQDELLLNQDYLRVDQQSLTSLKFTKSAKDNTCSSSSSNTKTYGIGCSCNSNHVMNAFPVVNYLTIKPGIITITNYTSLVLESISAIGWNNVNLRYFVYYYDGNTYQLGCHTTSTNTTCVIDNLPDGGITTNLLIKADGISYFGVTPTVFSHQIPLPRAPLLTKLKTYPMGPTSIGIGYNYEYGYPNEQATFNVTVNGNQITNCIYQQYCEVGGLQYGSTVNISVVATSFGKQSAALTYQQLLHNPVSITNLKAEWTETSISVYYSSKGGIPGQATLYSVYINGSLAKGCNLTTESSCTITNITSFETYHIRLHAYNDGESKQSEYIYILIEDFKVSTGFIVGVIFVTFGFLSICGYAAITYRKIYLDKYMFKKIFIGSKKRFQKILNHHESESLLNDYSSSNSGSRNNSDSEDEGVEIVL